MLYDDIIATLSLAGLGSIHSHPLSTVAILPDFPVTPVCYQPVCAAKIRFYSHAVTVSYGFLPISTAFYRILPIGYSVSATWSGNRADIERITS